MLPNAAKALTACGHDTKEDHCTAAEGRASSEVRIIRIQRNHPDPNPIQPRHRLRAPWCPIHRSEPTSDFTSRRPAAESRANVI